MKAKIFNKDNSSNVREHDPFFSINLRGGVMSLTLGFIEGAKIPKGARLDFIQDVDKPKDWYVRVVNDDSGFPSRLNGSGGYMVNSSVVSRTILDSLEVEDSDASYRMKISTTPTIDKDLGPLFAMYRLPNLKKSKPRSAPSAKPERSNALQYYSQKRKQLKKLLRRKLHLKRKRND